MTKSSTHELKTWQAFYDAVADGRKTFEVRRNDRNFRVGDILWLREWDVYDGGGYTGRHCSFLISYVLSGDEVVDFGVQRGYVVLGLAPLKAQPAPVPLAEDEALIARFKEIVTFCNTMGPRGSISVNDLGTLGNILERLSLRSGQLAQVRALCEARWQDAGYVGVSEAMNDEAVFLCKLRKAIEGAK